MSRAAKSSFQKPCFSCCVYGTRQRFIQISWGSLIYYPKLAESVVALTGTFFLRNAPELASGRDARASVGELFCKERERASLWERCSHPTGESFNARMARRAFTMVRAPPNKITMRNKHIPATKNHRTDYFQGETKIWTQKFLVEKLFPKKAFAPIF